MVAIDVFNSYPGDKINGQSFPGLIVHQKNNPDLIALGFFKNLSSPREDLPTLLDR